MFLERLKGATLAQQICAECHAVQAGQPRSPNGRAPTFENRGENPRHDRHRSYRNPPHVPPHMPNIVLADDDLRNVIAYIMTLR
jgi:mono/diheme cytochrome c family protein